MPEEEEKQEEKFDFTSEGEAVNYISLAQARLLAMQTAGEAPGNYGSQYQDVSMAFESAASAEEEDYYSITLSFRPQGDFSSDPGQEQFFIKKEGTVAVRQVLSLPRRGGRFPVLPVAIGLVIVGVIAAVAVIFAVGGFGDGGGNSDSVTVAAPTETPVSIVVPILPTDTPTSPPTAEPVVVEKEVIKEIPVDKQVIKEVPKEVVVEKEVIKEVVKEVPVVLEIGTNGDALEFRESALSAASGSSVTVTFTNGSSVNQHNWVLVQSGTKDAVATDGTGAGPGDDWIKPGDERVIASSKLLNPGGSEAVTFTAPAPGTYQFVCTFPGHNFTMFGDFEVK